MAGMDSDTCQTFVMGRKFERVLVLSRLQELIRRHYDTAAGYDMRMLAADIERGLEISEKIGGTSSEDSPELPFGAGEQKK